MNDKLIALKKQSCRLARQHNLPSFYSDFAEEADFSSDLFFNNQALLKLQEDSVAFFYDDYMFGIEHSKRLAQDACTILLAWDNGLTSQASRRTGLLAQVAAMIRDIECSDGESDRSQGSALSLLDGCPLSPEEKRLVTRACTCRTRPDPAEMPEGSELRALSFSLHDAYWFRFGPDIFSTVMWIYCDYTTLSLPELVDQFEKGVDAARYASDGFLTEPGRKYGPEILQAGVEQGELMLKLLREAAGMEEGR
ncbi:hypothetical protein [Paucidesulfovibrio longus]|uniref:hypothetical protein n=1 Tax=Paucidesulfovibrio longus TaxID=889 RepID=UPI0003B66959|nr:hypothetical protein [Paucidesulfovibrio longus]